MSDLFLSKGREVEPLAATNTVLGCPVAPGTQNNETNADMVCRLLLTFRTPFFLTFSAKGAEN